MVLWWTELNVLQAYVLEKYNFTQFLKNENYYVNDFSMTT